MKIVYALRCQGLGLLTDRLFVSKDSPEAQEFQRRMARRDADLYGVEPRTKKKRNLLVRWEKLRLAGDPLLLEDAKAEDELAAGDAAGGEVPPLRVNGTVVTTPAALPPPIPIVEQTEPAESFVAGVNWPHDEDNGGT